MTPMQLVYLATAIGAAMFFAAGLFAHALRHPVPPTPTIVTAALAPPPPPPQPSLDSTTVTSLRSELEHTRSQAAINARDRDTSDRRARDAEARTAEQAKTLRELSTETERMRGRVADAEALRADYVRLRTIATDTDFLKSEVARLERELRDARISALNNGAPRTPMASRASSAGTTIVAHPNANTNVSAPAHALAKLPPKLPRAASPQEPPSIGEALGTALARFADADTRASAVADALGFPLASTGDDGQALAAYGALLLDAAQRAGQFLPIARPVAIELVDERGAHVAAYAFDVDADRLMLVNLAVNSVEATRLDPTLVELATILQPSRLPS